MGCGSHLVLLALLGIIIGEMRLHGFHKIPFTCSYQPGKSRLNMAALAFGCVVFLMEKGAAVEEAALRSRALYVAIAGGLVAAAVLCWWRTGAEAQSEGVSLKFDDPPEPAILPLGLYRDGVLSIES
jgi:tetrahydromethanopterin S-methyltransferase subunit E